MANRLIKGLVKSSRYVASNPRITSSCFKLKTLEKCNENRKCLLLRKCYGLKDCGGCYFTLLSTEGEESHLFSPMDNIYTPFPTGSRNPVEIIGSANGLLCLGDTYLDGKLVLWNPSTQSFKFLPPTAAPPPPSPHISVVFTCSGFGFDPISNDYKVIRMVENLDNEDEECTLNDIVRHLEVYSLKSDSWRLVPYPKIYPLPEKSVYVNGVYYWIGVIDAGSESCIMSFNFSTEKFEPLSIPDRSKTNCSFYDMSFLDYDGLLCVVVYPLYAVDKCFSIWTLNEDKSWRKIHDLCVVGADIPLGFWGKDIILFEDANRTLLMHDLATGRIKNLGICEPPDTMRLITHVTSTSDPLLSGRKEDERAGH